MKASGICGTDLEKLHGGYTASQILGHEVSGVVVESNTDSFVVGDTVVPHHHVACGACFYCERGAITMCEGFRRSNFVPGGFADEIEVPAYNVSRGGVHFMNSSSISFEEASFAELLGCCIRGLEQTGITSSGSEKKIRNALIVGSGPIGLLHMELLRSFNPDIRLFASDVLEKRLKFAERNEGADPILLGPNLPSLSENAKRQTDSMGFDLVLVATGHPSVFGEAVRSSRKSGKILQFGVPSKGATHQLDLVSFFLSELTLLTSYATGEQELQKAIELLEAKKIDVKKFISGTFRLEKIVEAMDAARSEDQVKVIVTD